MRKLFSILLATLFLIMSSCSVKESTNKDKSQGTKQDIDLKEVKNTNQNQISKSSKTSPKTYLIEVEFLSEDAINISNPNFEITIYGSDKTLADVPATPILVKNVKATSLPTKFSIQLPDNPENIIIPKISNVQNAKYYVAIKWDNNNNNLKDKGDIDIDYKAKWPTIELNEKNTQNIYLKSL